VEILHRGKPKRLTRRQWSWVKRRQAVEPVIGHLKDDCRLRRNRLKGALGDALHVLSCAAGYNLRWLLRWIALFLGLDFAALHRNLWSAEPRDRDAGSVNVKCSGTTIDRSISQRQNGRI